MEMVANIQVEQLILTHFSSRYSQEEIDQAILQQCEKHQIDIPVFRVLPGETSRDILKGVPVNGG